MYTIQLGKNTSLEQYKMAIRVLKAIGVLDDDTENYNPFELTEEDLLAISKSDEDIKEKRLTGNKEVHKEAKEICIK